MEISDNRPIVTNSYPIFEWSPLFPILDDDEDEIEILNAMEQVAHDAHAEPDDEDE